MENEDSSGKEIRSCCSGQGNGSGGQGNSSSKGFLRNAFYALVPHAGCIAFLAATVLGVTGATALLRPLMMSANFFYLLILFSFGMTTASVLLYLRKNGILSLDGARIKAGYIALMYGLTVGINLLLFLVVFPYAANFGTSATAMALLDGGKSGEPSSLLSSLSSITLSVAIPCSGHATLISGDLGKLEGVKSVRFSMPNRFEVVYDPEKASRDDILSLDVFGTYPATVETESAGAVTASAAVGSDVKELPEKKAGGCGCGSCGGSCGGSGGCGGGNVKSVKWPGLE